jgi:hypothetical protein
MEIRRLALWLLKRWHEDGMAGMGLVCGKLRQMGRQLVCENWPRARVAPDGVAKIIFSAA